MHCTALRGTALHFKTISSNDCNIPHKNFRDVTLTVEEFSETHTDLRDVTLAMEDFSEPTET